MSQYLIVGGFHLFFSYFSQHLYFLSQALYHITSQFYLICLTYVCVTIFQVRNNFRTAITIPERSWGRFRDTLSEFVSKSSTKAEPE